MNLTVSPINTKTGYSQNVSSKGFFNKLFKASKNPAKDVFIASTAATAVSTGAITTARTQNSKETDMAMDQIYRDLEEMYKFAGKSCFESLIKNVNNNLEKLPDDSTKVFINEAMSSITNAIENNPSKLFSRYSSFGKVMIGLSGEFILETCANLLAINAGAEWANNQDFAEQVQKDILTSKNIMQLMNNGDWEAISKLDLNPSASKYL